MTTVALPPERLNQILRPQSLRTSLAQLTRERADAMINELVPNVESVSITSCQERRKGRLVSDVFAIVIFFNDGGPEVSVKYQGDLWNALHMALDKCTNREIERSRAVKPEPRDQAEGLRRMAVTHAR